MDIASRNAGGFCLAPQTARRSGLIRVGDAASQILLSSGGKPCRRGQRLRSPQRGVGAAGVARPRVRNRASRGERHRARPAIDPCDSIGAPRQRRDCSRDRAGAGLPRSARNTAGGHRRPAEQKPRRCRKARRRTRLALSGRLRRLGGGADLALDGDARRSPRLGGRRGPVQVGAVIRPTFYTSLLSLPSPELSPRPRTPSPGCWIADPADPSCGTGDHTVEAPKRALSPSPGALACDAR
jgi:hypothetical protein